MNGQVFSLPITEVGECDLKGSPKLSPQNYMHYCSPGSGGWGIIRVALLVPESVMLFVSPAACGRHGAIAGFHLGFKKRLFFLQISENDVVTGQHLDKITLATAEILNSVKPKPRAMIICSTCIDDLLGSDYDTISTRIAKDYDIAVRLCRMDPITRERKTAPEFSVQQAIYDFIPHSTTSDSGVNIVGCFAPIEEDSEFYEVLCRAGINKIRHIAACSSLEELYSMGCSTHNILLKPAGRLAAQDMERKLGLPFCFEPVVYGMDNITGAYSRLEQFLEVKLDTERFREEVLGEIRYYQRRLGQISIAVGESINASPFELARALSEYGFAVPYIFADQLLDFDQEHLRWLQINRPNIRVFTNIHPTMVDILEEKLTVDLAIGLEAGYFCAGAKTVPLTLDSQPYGYRGVISLLRQMLDAVNNPRSHREQVYDSGLVI
ncbi:MAG: hypothetical protein GXY40_10325 [Syntrophomonadaceae bacterium]|nr:hypothetical protein [Syntrophomonadaceae bacterium]